jgi:hypothetical protein
MSKSRGLLTADAVDEAAGGAASATKSGYVLFEIACLGVVHL